MNSLEKINNLCISISKLTNKDFDTVHKLIQHQKDYVHPLLNGKAKKINNSGNNNQEILDFLRNFRDFLIEKNSKI